ncbi:hypothetical protein J6Z19_09120 [bacterium]|nr:hypothetical protein [bacterium]
MNKKFSVFIFIFLLFANLHAVLSDRISGDKIPSLSATVSLEESNFLYNAPLIQYLNLNFGLMVNRFQNPGMKFGIGWQWLDSEHVAGLLKIDGFFLTNRHFNKMYLGGEAAATVSAGIKISGFRGEFLTIVTADPIDTSDTRVALELRLGTYVSPHESVNIYLAPALGKYFVERSNFYFNLVLATEVFLWK